ncbi:MAG TPA: transglycosylase domain-containing protein [Bacillota bacterium]
MKHFAKIMAIIVISLLVVAILVFTINLNRIDASIINFSFAKIKKITVNYNNQPSDSTPVKMYSETPLSYIPPLVQKIYISMYDNGFYEYKPSFKEIIRELIFMGSIDLRHFLGITYNGSYEQDILTKIAHNALVVNQKKIPLLCQQAYLAVKIRKKYSKEVLMERYLNQLYFGKGVFGIEAGARFYFGKKISSLQLHQTVLLCLISIDYYGGRMDSYVQRILEPSLLMKRRNRFLDSLVSNDIITCKQAEESKRKPLDLVVNLGSQG